MAACLIQLSNGYHNCPLSPCFNVNVEISSSTCTLFKITTGHQTTRVYDTATSTSSSPKCDCCLPCVDENTSVICRFYFRHIKLVSKRLKNVVAMGSTFVYIFFFILVYAWFIKHNIEKVRN